MDNYRLFVYRDDGQLVGSAVIIDAASRHASCKRRAAGSPAMATAVPCALLVRARPDFYPAARRLGLASSTHVFRVPIELKCPIL